MCVCFILEFCCLRKYLSYIKNTNQKYMSNNIMCQKMFSLVEVFIEYLFSIQYTI